MTNRKNRKFLAKNADSKPERMLRPSGHAAIAAMQTPSIEAKRAFPYGAEKLNPEITNRCRHITREIKRSLLCGAITLCALIILYFIFK
jgi:hypothetical protein